MKTWEEKNAKKKKLEYRYLNELGLLIGLAVFRANKRDADGAPIFDFAYLCGFCKTRSETIEN
jgi:hypothetical protein